MSKPTPSDGVPAFSVDSGPSPKVTPVWERRIVLSLIAAALLLASLPYALAYAITPPGTRFVGAAYNIDDYCNYLSWVRQTMDGRFFLHNQFTTEPQRNLEFNLFFWVLGRGAAVLHLSPQAALQVARIGGGVALSGIGVQVLQCGSAPERAGARDGVCIRLPFGRVGVAGLVTVARQKPAWQPGRCVAAGSVHVPDPLDIGADDSQHGIDCRGLVLPAARRTDRAVAVCCRGRSVRGRAGQYPLV